MSSENKFNLRNLPYSPDKNPLIDGFEMKTKLKKKVSTGGVSSLVDTDTGVVHQAVIVEEQEVDETQFVKVFTAGIRAAFGLTATGSRVFQSILDVYQTQPMAGGFAESVYLFWFDGGLDGRKLEMSEKTYQRGLKELLEAGFLYPRSGNMFWVNPNLFFRGNRATFIKTYRIRDKSPDESVRDRLENKGQSRLIE